MNFAEEFKLQQRKLQAIQDKEWYTVRSILGNTWASFFILLGGREAGKSYNVMQYFIHDYVKNGTPFTWLRLTEASAKKLLNNNADKFVDPDIRRKNNLDLFTKGCQVYNKITTKEKGEDGKIHTKSVVKPMAKILALSTFYADKGVALFDNEYDGYYNICLDEMNREKNEKNNFDIVYAFVNQMENLVRSTKQKLRIFLIGNTLEEASDIMTCFNFIPENFGRYYVRKKKAVVDYIAPSKAYLKRRRGTVADLLTPTASTFTNKIEVDKSLVDKRRLHKLSYIIKFTKDQDTWFCVYDSNVVKRYNNETSHNVIPMRTYLDEVFVTDRRDGVLAMYDAKAYHYRDLITQKVFKKQLELLKPTR